MKMFLQRALPVWSSSDLRRFYPRDRIRQLLKEKRPDDRFENDKDLLIFDTMRQHTWLIPSREKLFCVIDNRREETPKILWGVDLDALRNYGFEVEDFDEEFGILKVADKRVRKFSKSLFSATELGRKLRELIAEK